ncbi:beta-defensin 113 [Bos taurus]|uniref:Beta-defensin n=1 Tax=Bos indicus x Bos taurus TaxID=30522 RepID=A0A4W2BY11_BOBOX|nr:beta-defensin 113 [Bos taurus]
MKILCIFLTFILTVSCGPAVLQRKTREKTKQIEERKRQCYLVRGACKTSCGQWEYKYTDCDLEPCCVAREYVPPVQPIAITKSYKTVTYTSTILYNTANASYNSSTLHNTTYVNYTSTTLPNTTDVNYTSATLHTTNASYNDLHHST